MPAHLKESVFVLATWLCLAEGCTRSPPAPVPAGLPTEEALRRELRPNERLVHYERELLTGLDREIVRTRVLDTQTRTVSESIRTAEGKESRDYLTLRQLNYDEIRAKHGAGGEGFARRMDGRPERALDFTVQFTAGADPAKATREIAGLGAVVEATFQDLVRIKALPAVAKTIAGLPNVDALVEGQPRTVQALNMARDLEQPPLTQKHADGLGRELLAAIWEPESCINRQHPDFKRVQWQDRFTSDCDPKASRIAFHSTMVANVFAAFRPDGTAGLFQGRLFDVDDQDKMAVNDMWARSPNIVNASFTTSIFDGKRIDTEVHSRRAVHVFTGVGNQLVNGDQISCFGYNALCVGGYIDHGTIGAYADDSIGGSSWKNVNRIEMPMVLGPIVGGKLATSSFSGVPPGYQSASGSSFATPAIAGLAALLIANYPFELVGQPEAVRAVLMASAQVHPIVSEGRTIPDFNDGIDDRMGVGAPNGLRARKIMDDHAVRHGSFLPRVPSQPGLGVVTFTADFGDSVRVVLTWEQCPDYNIGDPQLSVDLDMVVAAPGQLPGPGSAPTLFTNLSQHDNWEIVQFRMPRAGTVAIHVSAPVFRPCALSRNSQTVNFGLAWSTMPAVLQAQDVALQRSRDR